MTDEDASSQAHVRDSWAPFGGWRQGGAGLQEWVSDHFRTNDEEGGKEVDEGRCITNKQSEKGGKEEVGEKERRK